MFASWAKVDNTRLTCIFNICQGVGGVGGVRGDLQGWPENGWGGKKLKGVANFSEGWGVVSTADQINRGGGWTGVGVARGRGLSSYL